MGGRGNGVLYVCVLVAKMVSAIHYVAPHAHGTSPKTPSCAIEFRSVSRIKKLAFPSERNEKICEATCACGHFAFAFVLWHCMRGMRIASDVRVCC